MPRLPRLDTPDSRHHVMNRGARREPVFMDTACCERFIELMSALPGRFGVRIHGYTLMPNHFHILTRAGPHGLGDAMKFLQGEYGRWFNAHYAWDGPLWRARYKSRLVESEDYWRHLLAYVHLNPVRAGLVPRVGLSTWTSHAAYAGTTLVPDWLTTTEHDELFGSPSAYLEYLDDLVRGRDVAPDGFNPDALFRGDARVLPSAVERPDKPERPLDWPMSPEAAWVALEMVTGKTREELTRRPRGPGANRLWWLTAWWLCLATDRRPSWWASELHVARSVVSRGRRRLEQVVDEDEQLARWQARLTGLVERS